MARGWPPFDRFRVKVGKDIKERGGKRGGDKYQKNIKTP